MNINLERGTYEVGVLDFDLDNISLADYDLYLFAAKNIARECLGEAHYVFEDGRDRMVILFQCDSVGEEMHEVFYDTLCVIQKAIFNTIQIKTTCAVGNLASSAKELNSAYRSAEKALEFGEMLKKRTGLEVIMWDERLTTVSADRALMEAGVRRENRKEYLDGIAAVFILQGYLDSLKM